MILDLNPLLWLLYVLGAAVVVVLVGAVNLGVHELAAQRREARARAVLGPLGLTVVHGDPTGLARVPTGITDRGTGQRIRFTVIGTLNGGPVRVAELEYRRSFDNPRGPSSAGEMALWLVVEAVRQLLDLFTRRRLTIAAIEVPGASWPHLQIDARRSGATRTTRQQAQRTIAFESDEFNGLFHVTGQDRRFASYALGPLAVDHLTRHAHQFDVEVRGRWIVAIGGPASGVRLLEVQQAVRGFAERIQPVTFEVYGGQPPFPVITSA